MTAELSKHERLIAEDRAKNTAPLGVAGPDDPIKFVCDAGINLAWRPPLGAGTVPLRGDAGTVFRVPEGDALSFIFDSLPDKLPGFRWVSPPSDALLAAQHAAYDPGRYPGWGTGETTLENLKDKRGKLPLPVVELTEGHRPSDG
jgi:hypothetical protein